MRSVGRTSLLGLLLLVAACTSSTGGTASPASTASASLPSSGGTYLDAGAVEDAVAGQFDEREAVALDLSCDQRMAVEVGAEYRCGGTTADGEDIEVLIRVTDDDGAYTWAEGD